MRLTAAQRRTFRTLLAPKPRPMDVFELLAMAGLDPKRHLCGADWRGADFGARSVRGLDFRHADLRGADLSRVTDLNKAKLDGADLRGAWLPASHARSRVSFTRWRDPVPGLPEAAWPDMVTLPAGVFTMGAPEGERDSQYNERPQREVTVRRPFALGRTAVTFAMWDVARAAGADLPHPKDQDWGRDQRPVIDVSWEDAQAYCAWLNARLGLRPGTYRLPSEAEWEYACRAGTVTPFSFGERITKKQVNHFDGRGDRMKGRTVPVGALPGNAWGLREMHGNVWEWCEDAYGPYPDRTTDSRPLIHAESAPRVLHGGAWFTDPRYCRSAYRLWNGPGERNDVVGFRLARALF